MNLPANEKNKIKEVSILAVIPTYNEENKIADTIFALSSLRGVKDVIVVDDQSSDNTVNEARKSGAHVVINPSNYGKGLSLNNVLIQNKDKDYSGVILADGDLGKSAEEFCKLINAFTEKNDLIIAGFGTPSKKGGFGFVKGLARWAISKYGGGFMNTPLSGQRLMTMEVLRAILPLANGFGVETDMTIKALKKKFKVIEVETIMTHDETGRDMVGFKHRGKQFVDVLIVVIRNIFTSKNNGAK